MKSNSLAALVLLLSALRSVTTQAWITETLVSGGFEGTIAVDNLDKLHSIYYSEYKTGNLMYTTNASGSWATEAVFSYDEVGDCSSFALDSSNKMHISCSLRSHGDSDLLHVTNVSGTWMVEAVDWIGKYASIAVDRRDKVHISYWYNGALKYATNVSGYWVDTTISSAGNGMVCGRATSIALDNRDKAHISYVRKLPFPMIHGFVTEVLGYTTNAHGNWSSRVVDPAAWAGANDTSIAVDSADNVHISYRDYRRGGVRYASNAAGYWIKGVLEDGWLHPSIAVDNSDKLHISYIAGDWDSPLLRYATRVGDSWVTTTVDNSYGPTSIAVTSEGSVWIFHRQLEGVLLLTSSSSCVDNDGDDYGDPGTPECVDPRWDCDDTQFNVNPGVAENCGNGIDDDCDGHIDRADSDCGYSAVANADASAHGPGSVTGSGVFNGVTVLLAPACAIILLRTWRRKK